jgi:hypothetical protein
VTFNYDAQHGMINATGMQANITSNAIPNAPPFTGTLTISVNITNASKFRPGTQYHCSVSFVGGELSTRVGLVAGGLETANGFAKRVAPGQFACSFTIAFAWSLPRSIPADTGLVVAVGVRALTPAVGCNGDGDDNKGDDKKGGGNGNCQPQPPQVLRSTFQLLGIETLPTSGFSQSFAFDVTR